MQQKRSSSVLARKDYFARGSAAWTSEAIQKLRALANAGASVKEIAAELGRSEPAIRNRASLHGISLRIRAVAN